MKKKLIACLCIALGSLFMVTGLFFSDSPLPMTGKTQQSILTVHHTDEKGSTISTSKKVYKKGAVVATTIPNKSGYVPITHIKRIVKLTDNTSVKVHYTKQTYLKAYRTEFLKLINKYRASKKVKKATYTAALEKSAEQRVDEIQTKFDHNRVTKSGKTGKFSTVFAEVGVKKPKYCGENLIKGFYVSNPKQMAQWDFSDWKNSSAHNKNMIDREFVKMGIATCKGRTVLLVSN